MSEQIPHWDHDDIPPPPPRLEQPANAGNGRFMSPRNQRERDVWAAQRQAIDAWEYRQIAEAMGISVASAWEGVQRGLRIIGAPTQVAAETARAAHRARLEAAVEAAMEVLGTKHITVSHGKVITTKDADGNDAPLTDHGPVLAAIDRLVRISESLRRLDGIDAPVEVHATVTETTQQDLELQDMVNEFRARNSAVEQQLRAQTKHPE